jgi:3-hydroxyisobutyrate dehydrogenase
MSTPRTEEIAFIGLGQMGLPMAQRLIKAGYSVRAYDLSPAPRETFQAAGGHAAGSAREACSGASIVITILPNGRVVREALFAGDAIKQAMDQALVIEMSSSDPIDTRNLGDELMKRGVALIDAPVSGGVKRAVDGTLAIMVGGDDAAAERANPILKAMGKSILKVGELGAGHAMKALNNYVSAAGLVAACEAVIVGQSFGLDPNTIVDVLNVSSGRNNSTETKMKPFVLSGSFGSGFSMGLMAKDVTIAASLSRSIDAPANGLLAAADLWSEAAKAMGPSTDHTAIFKYIANVTRGKRTQARSSTRTAKESRG